jgi:hypothetical protein
MTVSTETSARISDTQQSLEGPLAKWPIIRNYQSRYNLLHLADFRSQMRRMPRRSFSPAVNYFGIDLPSVSTFNSFEFKRSTRRYRRAAAATSPTLFTSIRPVLSSDLESYATLENRVFIGTLRCLLFPLLHFHLFRIDAIVESIIQHSLRSFLKNK